MKLTLLQKLARECDASERALANATARHTLNKATLKHAKEKHAKEKQEIK